HVERHSTRHCPNDEPRIDGSRTSNACEGLTERKLRRLELVGNRRSARMVLLIANARATRRAAYFIRAGLSREIAFAFQTAIARFAIRVRRARLNEAAV